MHIIAVLGAQNDPDGTLSPLAVARAETALAEYRCHHCAMMLVTGGYGHFNPTQRPHAHYVAQYLLHNGLQRQDLLPLAISDNTVEDAAVARMIAHGLPLSTLHVVTSEYHLDRARMIFEHFFPPSKLAMVCRALCCARPFGTALFGPRAKGNRHDPPAGGSFRW